MSEKETGKETKETLEKDLLEQITDVCAALAAERAMIESFSLVDEIDRECVAWGHRMGYSGIVKPLLEKYERIVPDYVKKGTAGDIIDIAHIKRFYHR